MADIATPAALAASTAVYPVAMAIGVPDPLALPLAVAAAGGASWAMSNRERVEDWNLRAAASALAAWMFSWRFGVLLGPIAGSMLLSWLPDRYAKALPSGAVTAGFALVLSAVAISHILPIALGQLKSRAGGL